MKEWLLAKSNIKKGKGTTIGLIILIILASIFLNIMLIICLVPIIPIKHHILLIILIFCCILFIFILNLCSEKMILAQSE